MLNRSIRVTVLWVSFLFASTQVLAYNANRQSGTADYALINARVYTMNEKAPWADAVTIEENKITYVGNAEGLKEHIGLGTEVIDLDGKVLMPGFVDAHIHAIAGGIIMKGVDLQTDDKDELFAMMLIPDILPPPFGCTLNLNCHIDYPYTLQMNQKDVG